MHSSQKQSFLKSIFCLNWTARTYFLTIIILYCLDQYYQQWSNIHLSSNLFITIFQYQIWRGLLNFLYQPNLYIIIVMFVHLATYLYKFEKQNGSIILFYQIVTAGLLVHFLTLVYQAVIYLLIDNKIISDKQWTVMYSVGAGGFLINLYFKFLFFNFKQSNRKCSLKAIFSYIYPCVLVILASYVSNQIRIDMIAGVILAMIECFLFKGGILFYTPDTYTKKQNIVYLLKLNRWLCCGWSNLNPNSIKPNNLLVVQARQFYNLKSYQPVNKGQAVQLSQIQIQTQRGVFQYRGRRMGDQQRSHQTKGQKWQKQEIIDDQ